MWTGQTTTYPRHLTPSWTWSDSWENTKSTTTFPYACTAGKTHQETPPTQMWPHCSAREANSNQQLTSRGEVTVGRGQRWNVTCVEMNWSPCVPAAFCHDTARMCNRWPTLLSASQIFTILSFNAAKKWRSWIFLNLNFKCYTCVFSLSLAVGLTRVILPSFFNVSLQKTELKTWRFVTC